MSDRLSLAHVIEETAGLDRARAERLSSAIFEAIGAGVATKADLGEAQLDLKARVGEVAATTKQEITRLEARIDLVEHRLLTRLGGLIVVGLTLLFAALHYWPPGHG